MKRHISIIKYIIIFLIILFVNLLLVPNNMDEVWNYGFSYAIRIGEIPYIDFNMVIPPFYPYFMALPLFINNSYLSFVIFNSIGITLMFYLLFKMYEEYTYLLLLMALILVPIIYPTYNSFLLILLTIIIYLEKTDYKNKDYLIGFLVAISILTKHSVGLFFIIPSLVFIKNKNINIIKRFIGFIIPNIIFIIYLLINNNLREFINLTILGMLDFTGNSLGITLSLIIFIIIVLISILIVIKNKKNINNYYLLLAYSIYLPIFDLLHLFYVIFIFLILLKENYKLNYIKYKLLFIVCILLIGIYISYSKFKLDFIYPNNINHFEYKFIHKKHQKYANDILDYLKDKNFIMYDDEAYFYRIALNQKITYLDIVNRGNHGYNGSDKIIELIEENKDRIFLIKKDSGDRISKRKTQLDKKGYDYIKNNFKKIDSIGYYDVYIFEKNFS